jgi:protein tyrosine phosphatase
VLCWPSKQKVPSSTVALVKLISAVNKWRAEIADAHETDRVLVLSEDGYTRVGVYCAATTCVDHARDRGLFDVFQAVKQVRKSRPQFVASVTELRYTYDLILHHLQIDKSVPRS